MALLLNVPPKIMLNWISEKKPFAFPANDIDFEEWHLGFDYFLSPEMTRLLFGKPKADQAIGPNQYVAKTGLMLDEHEQALG